MHEHSNWTTLVGLIRGLEWRTESGLANRPRHSGSVPR